MQKQFKAEGVRILDTSEVDNSTQIKWIEGHVGPQGEFAQPRDCVTIRGFIAQNFRSDKRRATADAWDET